MSRIIKLSESDLNRIVRRVISEDDFSKKKLSKQKVNELMDQLMDVGNISYEIRYGGSEKAWGGEKTYHTVFFDLKIDGAPRRIQFAFIDFGEGNGISDRALNVSYPSPQNIYPFNMIDPDVVHEYFVSVGREFLLNKLNETNLRSIVKRVINESEEQLKRMNYFIDLGFNKLHAYYLCHLDDTTTWGDLFNMYGKPVAGLFNNDPYTFMDFSLNKKTGDEMIDNYYPKYQTKIMGEAHDILFPNFFDNDSVAVNSFYDDYSIKLYNKYTK